MNHNILIVEEICDIMYRAGFTLAAQSEELWQELVDESPGYLAALRDRWHRHILATNIRKDTYHV